MNLNTYFIFPKREDCAMLEALAFRQNHKRLQKHGPGIADLSDFLRCQLHDKDGRTDDITILVQHAAIVPHCHLPPEIRHEIPPCPALQLRQHDFKGPHTVVLQRFRENMIALHVRCFDIVAAPFDPS